MQPNPLRVALDADRLFGVLFWRVHVVSKRLFLIFFKKELLPHTTLI